MASDPKTFWILIQKQAGVFDLKDTQPYLTHHLSWEVFTEWQEKGRKSFAKSCERCPWKREQNLSIGQVLWYSLGYSSATLRVDHLINCPDAFRYSPNKHLLFFNYQLITVSWLFPSANQCEKMLTPFPPHSQFAMCTIYSRVGKIKLQQAAVRTAKLRSNLLTKIAQPLTPHLASSCKALHVV